MTLDNKKKGFIALAAAVVMYFTPDEVDHIIEAGLAAFGIRALTVVNKDDGSCV